MVTCRKGKLLMEKEELKILIEMVQETSNVFWSFYNYTYIIVVHYSAAYLKIIPAMTISIFLLYRKRSDWRCKALMEDCKIYKGGWMK